MYTQSAFRHGPYVAHLSLLPITEAQKQLNHSIPNSEGPDAHRKLLQTYFQANEAKYILRAQFASSPLMHSVEDASIVWPEANAPFYDLATVSFPKQDSYVPQRVEWWENEIALSPFNGLEAHRPLGSVNRLRKKVYAMSRSKREEVNGQKSHFPQSVNEMP